MTPDAKTQLIRAHVGCQRGVDAGGAGCLQGCLPADQQEAADHLRRLLDTQRQADAACAALEVHLRQADNRIRTFPRWADHATPAWRWLLTTIEQESPQWALNVHGR